MEEGSQVEVKTLPHTIRKPLSSRFKRRLKLAGTVMGVYALSATLIAGALFTNTPEEVAQAGSTEQLSTAIRFIEEKSFQRGDTVQVAITAQNLLSTSALNNVSIDMLSTAEAVDWQVLTDSEGREYTETSPDVFSAPTISAGERFEIVASGVLQEQEYDFLSIQSRFSYVYDSQQSSVLTNQIFTGLESLEFSKALPDLTTDIEVYSVGQTISLASEVGEVEKARVYVSDRDNNISVSFADCEVNPEEGICRVSFTQLPVGRYSAIVLDEEQHVLSGIALFEVQGNGVFTPSSQAQLILPFDNTSINGKIPVVVERALAKNQVPTSRDACTIDLLDNSQVVTSLTSRVDSDRLCRFVIDAVSLNLEPKIYEVSLVGTELKSFVSVSDHSYDLTLNTQPPVLVGENVQVFLEGLIPTDPDQSVTLGIWHPFSGEYNEYTSILGSSLSVTGGEFATSLPAELFSNGGTYNVFAKLEDGRRTDFLQIQFESNRAGNSETGIIINPIEQISAGNTFTLSVEGVTDASGEYIQAGSCSAYLYTAQSGINPQAEIAGDITSGNCRVNVPAGTITTSGPVVATFSQTQTGVAIDQTKVIDIRPGLPVNWGQLQFASEPLTQNHANVLIIGPVTDGFLNHANVDTAQVVIRSGEDTLMNEFVSIDQGFGELVVPASILDRELIQIQVFQGETEILNNTFTISSNETIALPDFPMVVNGDQSFDIVRQAVSDEFSSTCEIRLIRSEFELVSELFEVSSNGGCEIEWSPNQYRNSEKVMLQLAVDNMLYHSVVKLEAGRGVSNFAVLPRTVSRPGQQVHVDLLTSVITDQHGKPAQNEIQWQLNSQSATTQIEDGLSMYSVSEIRPDDIKSTFGQTFYDVDLVARASELSSSVTNNITLNVGAQEIIPRSTIEILESQSHIQPETSYVFAYRVPQCNAYLKSVADGSVIGLASHSQGGVCYVNVIAPEGQYKLIFEEDGHQDAEFDVLSTNTYPRVTWCDQSPCYPQIRDTFIDELSIKLLEDGQEFELSSNASQPLIFDSEDISQTSLYTIKLEYMNETSQKVEFITQLSGAYLVE